MHAPTLQIQPNQQSLIIHVHLKTAVRIGRVGVGSGAPSPSGWVCRQFTASRRCSSSPDLPKDTAENIMEKEGNATGEQNYLFSVTGNHYYQRMLGDNGFTAFLFQGLVVLPQRLISLPGPGAWLMDDPLVN